MSKKAIETLRNGLEDSHWYSDDDEKIFNELVIKAKAFDAVLKSYDKSYSNSHLGDEVIGIIQKYESGDYDVKK